MRFFFVKVHAKDPFNLESCETVRRRVKTELVKASLSVYRIVPISVHCTATVIDLQEEKAEWDLRVV